MQLTKREFLFQMAAGLSVRDHGAAGDGRRLDTKALQSAIDACARGGGGIVRFPAGTYLSGTLFLRSRVGLYLEPGATLAGSTDLRDYPPTVAKLRSYTDTYTDKSLIYAEDLDDISISGAGVIDGHGAAFKGPYKVRPYMLRFINCRGVRVSGVRIVNSPMWVQHYLACQDVAIDGITVHSRVNVNNDGIDIDGSRRVRISNCDISSGDDAIVLKSTLAQPARDITITNCVLTTACNALKLGTESNGGFENIAISNCTIYDTRLAGVALETVDGGTLDRVVVSNVTMNGVGAPVFIRLGDRARPFEAGAPRPPVGRLRNVLVSGIEASKAGPVGCAVAGLASTPLENITLENLRLTFAGGGKAREGEVPEVADKYPEFKMFGPLPAYGLWCRHVRGLTLRNIRTAAASEDERPALECDEVEGLDFSGGGMAGAIRLRQVRDAFLHGSRVASLAVAGERSARINVTGNELGKLEVEADAATNAVFLAANRRG